MTKPQPKDTQGDKGRYENNVQLVQWISSVYTSANDKYMETRLVQWISSEIKLRRSHHTRRNPKPYAGAYYIIRTNEGKNIYAIWFVHLTVSQNILSSKTALAEHSLTWNNVG